MLIGQKVIFKKRNAKILNATNANPRMLSLIWKWNMNTTKTKPQILVGPKQRAGKKILMTSSWVCFPLQRLILRQENFQMNKDTGETQTGVVRFCMIYVEECVA